MKKVKARVCRSDKRDFYCQDEDGEFVTATALGNLLKGKNSIVIGDYVMVEFQDDGPVVVETLERENEVYRILVRERKKRPMAANVDLLVFLQSVSKPGYKQGLLDRLLVRAAQWDIPAIVIFNKMDEYNEKDFNIKEEALRFERLGILSFEISAVVHERKAEYLENGPDELKDFLADKTALFLGHSGVGKSKTISFLTDGEVDLRTNRVAKSGKGSHTTTWSELIDCGRFTLVDSPGVKSYSLDDINPDDLLELFPDLFEIARGCKFADCQHLEKSKGCAFFRGDEKVDSITLSRLASFQKIYEEVSETETWKKTY